MNTFTFGRVDNMKVDVNGWQMDGDEVRVSGFTEYGEYAEAITIRNQLLGYGMGRDEDVVPIVWDDRPENNGFYQVLSINATEDVSRAPFGVIDWSMNLYRIQGFAAPLVEATVVGGTRENTRMMNSLWYIGVPGSVRSFIEYDPLTAQYFTHLPATREAESGTVAVFTGGQRVKQWYIDPDKFYEGAAAIKMGGDVVIGRRMKNDPENWEVNNGLLRIRPVSGSIFRLRVNTWLPATDAWSDDWDIDMQGAGGSDTSADLNEPHTVTVLRNTPEEVILRFSTTTSGGNDPITVDMSVKRGAYHASFYWKSTFSNKMGIQPVSGMSGWKGHLGGWFRGWFQTPARINVATNPSVTLNDTGWAAMAGTGARMTSGATTDPAAYDICVYRATATASHSASAFGIRVGSTSTSYIPVTAGTTYRVSMYGKCSVGKTMQINVKYYNISNVQVGSTVSSSAQVMTAGTWYRFNATATAAPAGAVRLVIEFVGNTSWVAGEHVEADAVLVEATSALNPYFDGNSLWGGGFYYAWEGEVGLSASIQYAPSGTDGGHFIGGPQKIDAAATQFTPGEGGVSQVVEWSNVIGRVPNDRSVDLWDEFMRYYWATTDRVAVVAQ